MLGPSLYAPHFNVMDAEEVRPIVGVELVVETVEAKLKNSQNRSDADRAGVKAGLTADGRDPNGLVAP